MHVLCRSFAQPTLPAAHSTNNTDRTTVIVNWAGDVSHKKIGNEIVTVRQLVVTLKKLHGAKQKGASLLGILMYGDSDKHKFPPVGMKAVWVNCSAFQHKFKAVADTLNEKPAFRSGVDAVLKLNSDDPELKFTEPKKSKCDSLYQPEMKDSIAGLTVGAQFNMVVGIVSAKQIVGGWKYVSHLIW